MIFEARNIRFSYAQEPLIKNLNFTVDKNMIYCLTGPNGSGKTTLIGLALRDLKPQEGNFYLSGKEISTLSQIELAREIAYVPQMHRRTFPYTVREVIGMGRNRFMNGKVSHSEEDKEIIEMIMDKLDLMSFAEVPYTLLSGGELQTVLIARALVQDSRLLIMDEPTANLDIDRSYRILHLLAELVQKERRTIFIVSHDLGVPLYLEDMGCPVTLALLYTGSIQIEDKPTKVLQHPQLQNVYSIRSLLIDTVWENNIRHATLHTL